MTVASVMSELKKKGSEQYRKTYARHGMDPKRLLGVSSAEMKTIAKSIRGKQELALALYKTGMMEAMYIAGLTASGSKMTVDQLEAWAEESDGLQMINEFTVVWVAVEHPQGRELALKWMGSEKDHLAALGWRTYAGLLVTKPDDELDLKEIEKLIGVAAKKIAKAPNRVKYVMNGFVISAGTHVAALTKRAMAVAGEIGEVKVDMGDTDCMVPDAIAAIEKVQAAGKIGSKKKTLRC